MSLRLPSERLSPLARTFQAFRAIVSALFVMLVFFALIQADPEFRYLTAVISVLSDWLNAALNR